MASHIVCYNIKRCKTLISCQQSHWAATRRKQNDGARGGSLYCNPWNQSYFEWRWLKDKSRYFFSIDEILALWWLNIKMLDQVGKTEENLLTR